MRCPTWDLPAGAPPVGGSCVGAIAGQSVVEPQLRVAQLAVVDGLYTLPAREPGTGKVIPFREFGRAGPICGHCYASAANYLSPHVQAGELVRLWWSRRCSQTEAGRSEWVRTIVRAMEALGYTVEHGIKPVRLHSSGDFFSPAYAGMWIAVANELWALDRRIKIWAPTRTWAARGWAETWNRLLPELASVRAGHEPNLVVRASAFHLGDHAPGKLHPTNAAGTTSIFADNNQGDRDQRYSFNCGVYSLKPGVSHTCQNAAAPNGEHGCRACWTALDTRVNFTTH